MELWVHGLPQDRNAALETLKRLGVSNLVTGGNPEIIAQAVEAGLAVYPCTHAYGIRKDDPQELLCLTIEGERRPWFNSNCPSHPEVQKRHLERVKELAGIPGIKGVFIDGARFASPASGIDVFFTCFCQECKVRAERFGLDFDRMQRDVASLYSGLPRFLTEQFGPRSTRLTGFPAATDLLAFAVQLPGVYDWFRFRALATSEHMRQVREVLKAENPALSLGMYVFTPCLSPLVGQLYPMLAEHVDIVAPMIYRNGPANSIAPLNSELARMWQDLGQAGGLNAEDAAAVVLSLAGYEALITEHSPDTLAQAMPPLAVARETASARALLGSEKRLAPIIWLNDDEIERCTRAVRDAGADGVNFYTYRDSGAQTFLERAVAALRT